MLSSREQCEQCEQLSKQSGCPDDCRCYACAAPVTLLNIHQNKRFVCRFLNKNRNKKCHNDEIYSHHTACYVAMWVLTLSSVLPVILARARATAFSAGMSFSSCAAADRNQGMICSSISFSASTALSPTTPRQAAKQQVSRLPTIACPTPLLLVLAHLETRHDQCSWLPKKMLNS